MKKIVSIIIPVYNAERYLDGCIKSILQQSYPTIELILVNDGSRDMSADICKAYQEADARVRYLYHDNKGVSATRNEGLDAATGDYIMFVDADDRLKPDAVQKMMETVRDKQVDLVLSGYECVYSDRTEPIVIEPCAIHLKEEIPAYFFAHYLEGIASSVWAKLYRKELIKHRFRTDLTMGEDMLFNMQYIKSISSVCAISDVLYEYDQTSTESLVRKYRPKYFEQDCIVCGEWLQWGRTLTLSKADMGNVYYRISSSFLTYMNYLVANNPIPEVRKALEGISSADLHDAICYSLDRYNVLHKCILLCMRNKKYSCAILCMKLYRLLKKNA